MTKAVFIPGLLCTDALYAPQVAALGGRLDIAIGDHRRHDTLAAIAGHILSSAPERFVLAGLSMGGYISLEILRQAPERVTALLLLDTSARADEPEKTARRRELVKISSEQGLDRVMDQLVPVFLAEESQQDAGLVATARKMASDTGPDTFARQQEALTARPDSRPSLVDIRCPTLVIVGDKDVLTPPDLAREIADAIPGSQLSVIENCGHLSTLEQPEAVNQAIETFLEGAGIIS